MDIKDLKQELLDKKTRHYYVFIGDELALQDIYIEKIKEVSGLESVRALDVKSVYNKLTAKTLIKSVPGIYIIRNDDDYYKSNLWKDLLKVKDFKGNILILLYSDVKKTSEFCKEHEAVLTSFDAISPSLLKNRVQAITAMPTNFCEEFVKMCGGSYSRMKNEMNKIQMYAIANKYTSWLISYTEAKNHHLLNEEIGDIIFDFTNAIVERNIKLAYELYPKILKTEDGSAIKLLSVLYNTFRQVLMVQSTPPEQRTEQELGLTRGQIYMTNTKCNRYNLYELVYIVKKIREIEKGIKVGTIEERFAMPYFMGCIW